VARVIGAAIGAAHACSNAMTKRAFVSACCITFPRMAD